MALFIDTTPTFGQAFYEISTFLRSLNHMIAVLTIFDINVILNRVKDQTDKISVAALTLDYILRCSA